MGHRYILVTNEERQHQSWLSGPKYECMAHEFEMQVLRRLRKYENLSDVESALLERITDEYYRIKQEYISVEGD